MAQWLRCMLLLQRTGVCSSTCEVTHNCCSSSSKGSDILFDHCGHCTQVECPREEPCSGLHSLASTHLPALPPSFSVLDPEPSASHLPAVPSTPRFIKAIKMIWFWGNSQRHVHLGVQYSVRLVFQDHPSRKAVSGLVSYIPMLTKDSTFSEPCGPRASILSC